MLDEEKLVEKIKPEIKVLKVVKVLMVFLFAILLVFVCFFVVKEFLNKSRVKNHNLILKTTEIFDDFTSKKYLLPKIEETTEDINETLPDYEDYSQSENELEQPEYVENHVTFSNNPFVNHSNYKMFSRVSKILLNPMPKIQWGEEARVGEISWAVSLFKINDSNLNEQPIYFCAGSLISESWILTASHCIQKGSKM